MAWRFILALRTRLKALIRTQRADDDLQDEIDFHLALQTRANLEHGMGETEAAREARLVLGGLEQVKEQSRDMRPMRWADSLRQDVRYALRSLRRTPGFTTVALLTLGLGLGANTIMFSLVDGILLRPLPYPASDRLVRLYEANPAGGRLRSRISLRNFEDWRAETRAFAGIALSDVIPSTLTGRGEPLEIKVAMIAGDFFAVLGAPPELGRSLIEEDHRLASRHVVISDGLWRTRFAADPNITGEPLLLHGEPFTIVGVMPSSFRYPTPDTAAWAPESVLSEQAIGPRERNVRVFDGVARLNDRVSLAAAQAELSAIAAQLAADYPQENAEWNAATVVPLRSTIVGDIDRALALVLGVVGFILLISCVNLANMLLARGAARSAEIALRTAIGASRLRIVRQLLTESLVLALAGGALGLALSIAGLRSVLALSADLLPRVDEVRIDGRIVVFGLILTIATGLLFGMLPAFRATGADAQRGLKVGRGATRRGRTLRGALIVAEVGLASLLVIGGGLMARSFLALRSVDAGLDPERVLTVSLQFNLTGVPTSEVASYLVRRRDELVDHIAALPGVVRVGTINAFPLRDDGILTMIDYRRADGGGSRGDRMLADTRFVHPDYFRAMGIPLRRGEPLPNRVPPSDARAKARSVRPLPALISDAAVRSLWPDRDPIGQELIAPWGRLIVTGIVGDVRQRTLAEDPAPAIYLPQMIAPRLLTTLAVRTTGDPRQLVEPIRQTVHDVDRNQPIRRIETMSDVISDSIARDRFFTMLFVTFGALALALAVVGVYGVLAYTVGQRTQEIGVRMALGARATDVLRMVVGAGMRQVGGGIALGALCALWLVPLLKSQLYGISAVDPFAFGVSLSVLTMAALMACAVPAWRATRIDPMTALRDQ